jgi:two-component system cell cycle sensor histidine kinase/response regulator CckA
MRTGVTDAHHESILVVEDDDAVRNVVTRMLERTGYVVHATAYPAEALRLVEQEAPHLDLVITDLVMPGLSGRELAMQIREYRPEIRVLYMSGYHHDASTRDGNESGHLEKPFSESQLALAIRATLDDARERVA